MKWYQVSPCEIIVNLICNIIALYIAINFKIHSSKIEEKELKEQRSVEYE